MLFMLDNVSIANYIITDDGSLNAENKIGTGPDRDYLGRYFKNKVLELSG